MNNINLTKLTTRTPHAIAAINYCLHHLYTWVSCATAALPTMSANCIPSELVVCRAVTRPLFFHTGVARARLNQSMIPLSPPTSHFNMQPHGSCMMEESSDSSADRNPRLRAQRQSLATQRLSSPLTETCSPKGSVKHDAMSKSLLKEGMLAYHITAAITACIIMAIPLTRANRLAAMKEYIS